MKKLLLSSIIMFGICSFVTAQNAADGKLKKTATTTTSTVAPTPQKAAVAPQPAATNDLKTLTPADKQAAAVAPTDAKAKIKADQAKAAGATLISADGTAIDPAVAQKQAAVKAAADKAAAQKAASTKD